MKPGRRCPVLPSLICCPWSPSPVSLPLPSDSQHTQASASSLLQTTPLTGFARNHPGWVPHRHWMWAPASQARCGGGPGWGDTRERTALWATTRGNPEGARDVAATSGVQVMVLQGIAKIPWAQTREVLNPTIQNPTFHPTNHRIPGQFSAGTRLTGFLFQPLGETVEDECLGEGRSVETLFPSSRECEQLMCGLVSTASLDAGRSTVLPQSSSHTRHGPTAGKLSLRWTLQGLSILLSHPIPKRETDGNISETCSQGEARYPRTQVTMRMHQEYRASLYSRLPMFTLPCSRN